MKTVLLSLAIFFSVNTLATDKVPVHTDKDVFTGLYFKTTSKVSWPIYLMPNGDRYALRVSNTGKEIRYFIPKSFGVKN